MNVIEEKVKLSKEIDQLEKEQRTWYEEETDKKLLVLYKRFYRLHFNKRK